MSQNSVLLFHSSADLYGSDQTALDLVLGLIAAGWRVEVALPLGGPLVELIEAAGARVHLGNFSPFGRATLRPLGLLRAPFQMTRSIAACKRLIRAVQPSLVHVNTLNIPEPALAAGRLGVPLIWHIHEIMLRPRALAAALSKLVGRVATRVVCNSRATLDQLGLYSQRIAKQGLVIANGVSAPAERSRAEARRALGLPEDRFVFLFVGRLNAWKGQELFVEAAARLSKQHEGALFLVAGDAPDGQPHFRDAFLELVEKHGLSDCLRWLGFVGDTHALYSAADVAVVPSLLPEPFGLVAAEAMAAALPVLAAGHGGLREIVLHGTTGLLFEPGDVNSLVQAMQQLLGDPELAGRMGRAGKARQAELFSVQRYQAEFMQLYQGLLAEERP